MITIIDYGAGNIGSVLNMIRHVGEQAEVTGDAAGVLGAKKILLPGVGSFDNAMTRLAGLGHGAYCAYWESTTRLHVEDLPNGTAWDGHAIAGP